MRPFRRLVRWLGERFGRQQQRVHLRAVFARVEGQRHGALRQRDIDGKFAPRPRARLPKVPVGARQHDPAARAGLCGRARTPRPAARG